MVRGGQIVFAKIEDERAVQTMVVKMCVARNRKVLAPSLLRLVGRSTVAGVKGSALNFE